MPGSLVAAANLSKPKQSEYLGCKTPFRAMRNGFCIFHCNSHPPPLFVEACPAIHQNADRIGSYSRQKQKQDYLPERWLVRHMNASIPQSPLRLPVQLSTVVWLSSLLSPTACFLLLLLASRLQINLPETVVWSLLFVIPAVALLLSESVAWSWGQTVGGKIGWMFFTLLAMLLQFAILLAILRTILVMAIGYAQ
jgi:hypothetical protein